MALQEWIAAGLIAIVSLVLGFVFDANEHVPPPWNRVSSVLGWIYFTCWAVSSYPQPLLNYQRKSVVGLSLDYMALSILGSVFYLIFNCAFFFSGSVREQYMRRDHGHKNAVELNDVISSIHGTFFCVVVVVQCFVYPKNDQTVNTKTRMWVIAVVAAAVVFGLAVAIAGSEDSTVLNTLNWLYLLSWLKIVTTLFKCVPQVVLNYRRQSTVGWTIWGVMLDLIGGLLSVLQQLIDSIATSDWSAITGDPVKFTLGMVSIAFDVIFAVQHYVLYAKNNQAASKAEQVPLL
ncbi:TPA: hypothetical protein N0F65_001378 [Lagenidium giganteum]|uniref:Cystinosin n=1 Tax=Lagenidium giganteum TaxID=4803 RepID=A0AAV2Z2K1_9STRA|nr:TPA: hypothetical protein N0F65_001378 [Lagenidium giganteum]